MSYPAEYPPAVSPPNWNAMVARVGALPAIPGDYNFKQGASYIVWTDGTDYYANDPYHTVFGGPDDIVVDGADGSAVMLEALNNLTGGRTWKEKVVVRGLHVWDDPIDVPSNTIIDLQEATIIGSAGLDGLCALYINGKSNVDVVSGLITGDGSSPTTTQNGVSYYYYTGVQINSSSNVKVFLNRNIGCWGAVNVYDSNNIYVFDNYGSYCCGGWQAVATTANIRNVHFHRNDAHEFGDDAISFLANNQTISDFSACFNSVDAPVTIDEPINNITGTGIKAAHTAGAGALYRGLIGFNQLTNLGQSALYCTSLYDTQIIGNRIYKVGQTSATQQNAVLLGVAATNPCSDLLVSHNYIDDAVGYGLFTESVTDSEFTNNTVLNTDAGIGGACYFWGATDIHFNYNKVRDNVGNGIYFTAGGGYHTLLANKFYNNTLYGINLGSEDYCQVIENDCQTNGSGAIVGNDTHDFFWHNRGFATEAWGTVSGATPITVTFSEALTTTPSCIQIKSNEEIECSYSGEDANGFDLAFTAGGARTFTYYARV